MLDLNGWVIVMSSPVAIVIFADLFFRGVSFGEASIIPYEEILDWLRELLNA